MENFHIIPNENIGIIINPQIFPLVKENINYTNERMDNNIMRNKTNYNSNTYFNTNNQNVFFLQESNKSMTEISEGCKEYYVPERIYIPDSLPQKAKLIDQTMTNDSDKSIVIKKGSTKSKKIYKIENSIQIRKKIETKITNKGINKNQTRSKKLYKVLSNNSNNKNNIINCQINANNSSRNIFRKTQDNYCLIRQKNYISFDHISPKSKNIKPQTQSTGKIYNKLKPNYKALHNPSIDKLLPEKCLIMKKNSLRYPLKKFHSNKSINKKNINEKKSVTNYSDLKSLKNISIFQQHSQFVIINYTNKSKKNNFNKIILTDNDYINQTNRTNFNSKTNDNINIPTNKISTHQSLLSFNKKNKKNKCENGINNYTNKKIIKPRNKKLQKNKTETTNKKIFENKKLKKNYNLSEEKRSYSLRKYKELRIQLDLKKIRRNNSFNYINPSLKVNTSCLFQSNQNNKTIFNLRLLKKIKKMKNEKIWTND